MKILILICAVIGAFLLSYLITTFLVWIALALASMAFGVTISYNIWMLGALVFFISLIVKNAIK